MSYREMLGRLAFYSLERRGMRYDIEMYKIMKGIDRANAQSFPPALWNQELAGIGLE